MTKGSPGAKTRTCAVLVNYFGADEVAQAAQSILADAPGCTVIVVDNSDDAAEATRLLERLPAPVRVIDAGGNLGFGQACNLAWQTSDCAFVAFVNPDVRLLPGCMAAMQSALEVDRSLAAASPRQFLDADCKWHLSGAWRPSALGQWAHRKALSDPRSALRRARAIHAEHVRLWTATAPVRQRALSGGALWLRRSAFPPGELPFDPRFFMYFEDSDLCVRLRRSGLAMAVVPDARAVHAWRHLPHKASLMEAGSRVYFDKHTGASGTMRACWLLKAAEIEAGAADDGGPFATTAVDGPTVAVPDVWQSAWLLELGLNPFMQPAIGCWGAGPWASVPPGVLEALGGARVYGRLTPRRLVPALHDARWWRWH